MVVVTHLYYESTLEWLGDHWAGNVIEGTDAGDRYMRNIRNLAEWL